MSTPPLRLCWWEVEELLEHLRSRPDLWTRSEESNALWLRTEPRLDDVDAQAFGLLIVEPSDKTSPYRQYVLQTIPILWDAEHTSSYLAWLVSGWTSHQRRATLTKLLREALDTPPETAPLAAIAIEALDWSEDGPEPEPGLPPLQEELWPRDPLPPLVFEKDPTLVGTFLLTQGAGWLQLRLNGGMLRVIAALRTKTGETLSLQGLLRPTRGRARDAAAKLAGWPEDEVPQGPELQELLKEEK